MELSRVEKEAIKPLFDIQRSGAIEVVDGQVISDGITQKDLAVVNIGSLIEFLGNGCLVTIPPEIDKLFDDLWYKAKANIFDIKVESKQETQATINTNKNTFGIKES